MSTVLVTGGTGLLGRAVVARLTSAGHDVRVLSRTAPGSPAVVGDLATGSGLDDAVAGVDTVVHCGVRPARSPTGRRDRHPVAGRCRPAGRFSPHLVYVSIVGVDRIPLAYYRAKAEAEREVALSGLPWTTLRATQFHEFTADLLVAAHPPADRAGTAGMAFPAGRRGRGRRPVRRQRSTPVRPAACPTSAVPRC